MSRRSVQSPTGGPPGRRDALTALTVAFVGLHVYHALIQGGGGWRRRHGGLGGAIVAFFRQSADDPVMSAGFSDFAAVATMLGAWMLVELPPEDRRRPRTLAWLGLFVLFPGLGALLYPLWIRPRHEG